MLAVDTDNESIARSVRSHPTRFSPRSGAGVVVEPPGHALMHDARLDERIALDHEAEAIIEADRVDLGVQPHDRVATPARGLDQGREQSGADAAPTPGAE